MAKKTKGDEPSILSAIQDLLIFQMATGGASQEQIRKALRLDNNRVSRIARLARKKKDGGNDL